MPDRVVLVMPTTTYRAEAFLEAARNAGVDVLVASDRCHVLDGVWEFPEDSLVIDFYEPRAAVDIIVAAATAAGGGVRAVVPAGGESAALVAAMAAAELGLPHNAVAAAQAAANKHRMRELCAAAGVKTPRFMLVGIDEPAEAAAERCAAALGRPWVMKPLLLSGSRGVMRVDDLAGFVAAHGRLAAMLRTPELLELDAAAGRQILVEEFVPGVEVALEGILSAGKLRTLAIFDKPDPLDGPFFEETLYVTPSTLPEETQAAVRRETAAAAAAMGLAEGPVHAELRLSPAGPVVIEIAARSIGGLCSRMLRFGTGLSLEDVIIRHALGREIAGLDREARAAGVMMLPIPRGGVLRAIDGVEAAQAVAGIDEVAITARIDQELVPLPEGSSYLGFVFAHGDTPAQVEGALREAHRRVRFTIAPTLPVAT